MTKTTELGAVEFAALTLMVLIIGFIFSMAIDRHCARQHPKSGSLGASLHGDSPEALSGALRRLACRCE